MNAKIGTAGHVPLNPRTRLAVTQGIDKLIEVLERAAAGQNIDVQYLRTLRLESLDESLEKAAVTSWRRLVHFADDSDIRSSDAGYDEQMKEEMAWRAR